LQFTIDDLLLGLRLPRRFARNDDSYHAIEISYCVGVAGTSKWIRMKNIIPAETGLGYEKHSGPQITTFWGLRCATRG